MAEYNQCSYDLAGLPTTGKCPECGQRYNTVTRLGIASRNDVGNRIIWRLRRGRTIFFVAISLMAIVCCGLWSTRTANPDKPLLFDLAVTILIVMAALTSYLYERDDL